MRRDDRTLAATCGRKAHTPRVLRLRTGAVSLSREADKAERRLEKLRNGRVQGCVEEAELFPEPKAPRESGRVEKTTALIEDNRKVAVYAEAHGLTWSEAMKQRRRDQRLAERRRKQEIRAQAA